MNNDSYEGDVVTAEYRKGTGQSMDERTYVQKFIRKTGQTDTT